MDVLKKINLTHKIIILNIVLILAIGSLIIKVIIPSVDDIKEKYSSIQAQRTDLDQKYIKGQTLRRRSENLKKIKPQLERLEQIFVDRNKELQFVTTLEDAANNKGVTQKISLGDPETVAKNYKKIPISITTSGNFLKQIDYLMSLEAFDFYINTKSIEISATGQGNTGMTLTADSFWK